MAIKLRYLFIFSFLTALAGCRDYIEYVNINGNTMGTTYSVTLSLPKSITSHAISTLINNRLLDIESCCSTYISDSDISQVNTVQPLIAVNVSNDFLQVFNIARNVYLLSNYAFDPTISPLVELWGFYDQTYLQQLPISSDVQQAKTLLGFLTVKQLKN